MSNTQAAIDAVRIIFKQDERIAELEEALQSVLSVMNTDEEGGYFICAEAAAMVVKATRIREAKND